MMLLSAGLASCSQDDMPQAGGTPLPEGEYPLTLTARVDGMNTRATGKDAWVDGDKIGVRIGTNDATGCYELNSDGLMKIVITPVYWQNTASSTVTAWYPYEEKIDVPISDQSKGFAKIDFLTATALEQSYKSSVSLKFEHQMAKVSYTLKKGDGITDENLEGATVQIAGYTKASFSEGELKGMDDGWITPAPDNDALLVPQNMKDRPFIKVSINGKDFTYTPSTETAGNLQAGSHNTYTITVKKDGIEVAGISASWNDNVNEGSAEEAIFRVYLPNGHGQTLDFSNDVTEKGDYLEVTGNSFTISCTVTEQNRMKGFPIDKGIGKMERTMSNNRYTFTYTLRSDLRLTYGDYAQAGDYYYSDGTWRPDYTSAKTCIGIVFKVGAGEGDDATNYGGVLQDNTIHGYAVALRDAHTATVVWGGDGVLIGTSTNQDDFLGYSNTQKIIGKANEEGHLKPNDSVKDYPAAYYISEYTKSHATGNISSGWYFPSTGQLKELWKVKEQIESRFSAVSGTWLNAEDYLSSSEYDRGYIAYNVGYVNFNDGKANFKEKDNQPARVRAVLTF